MKFKLLFIFSLPRSGSTLLQRLLSCHPNIATISEPWILLPLLTLFQKDCRIFSEFSIRFQRKALFDFLSKISNSNKLYFSAVRKFALTLYAKLASQDTRYVLDKTPRYYLIIDEIFNTFPDAKYIFLFRHPLAIMASVCQTFFRGNLISFKYSIDVFKGPFLLTQGYKKYSNKSFVVHYENLVNQPEKLIKELCDYLEIEYHSTILEKFGKINIKGIMGDKKCYNSDKIFKDSIYKWKKFFATPLRKKFAKNYLNYLGEEVISIMGYDYKSIMREIEDIKSVPKYFLKDILSIMRHKIYGIFEYNIIKDKLERKRKGLDCYPLS